MVDISKKPAVFREASAVGSIRLKAETVKLIREGNIAKGDPVYASEIAGILAAKKTSSLIPLCHPLSLTSVDVKVSISSKDRVEAVATVKTTAQTGVEMEALVAVTVALLTVWDMTKQYEKDASGQYPSTSIGDIRVTRKLKAERQR